ncbi:ATP-binding cassette domain-containing protein [Lactobacillus xylocopicola]|uniref:ABC transporter n=1 Tax=Lactobacillus xylocopicola TaxID=2976676 RepID=A0ABM8BIK4_9LACO|nr:ABC transporter ATP-binding protein [Lactobacillus xylocopicola]BDR61131.1 ABC transporter [Lactobacillus xylocopicola]
MNFKTFYRTSPLRIWLIVISSILQPFILITTSYLNMLQISALRNHNQKAWLTIIIVSLLAYLSSYFCDMSASYLLATHMREFNQQLREKVLRHLYDEKRNYQVTEVENQLTNDLNMVNDQYFNLLPTICVFLGYIIFSVIALLTINWTLLLITLLTVLISMLLPKLIDKPIQRAMENVSIKNRQYLDLVEKWLGGIAELQRYAAGDHLMSVMHLGAKRLEEAKLRQNAKQQILSIITGSISQVMIFALFVWTGVLIKKDIVPFGAIAVIGNFSHYMSTGIEYLPYYLGLIKGTSVLREQITRATLPMKNHSESESSEVPFSFKTKNLTIKFQNGETLKFPDIEIDYGEKILLTGDSGAGKSTLFKLILNFLEPSSGQIEFKNQNGEIINPDLTKIGYIAQNSILFPSTVKRNITMFNDNLNNLAEIAGKEMDLQADNTAFVQGLNTKINLQKLNISGGQRQKIILARAQVHHSNILLIDEGTSAIDQTATLKILHQLLQRPNTIIFIAHNFNQRMNNLFDREIHLNK